MWGKFPYLPSEAYGPTRQIWKSVLQRSRFHIVSSPFSFTAMFGCDFSKSSDYYGGIRLRGEMKSVREKKESMG